MRLPFNPFRYPAHWLRPWVVQPAFWVLFLMSPLLDWFRVDMLTQRIIFFGQPYPFSAWSVAWIPLGFYLGVLLIAVASFLFGRIFCGWACPHNTMTEWTRPWRALIGREPQPLWLRKLFQRAPWSKGLFVLAWPMVVFGLPMLLTLPLAGYVVPPGWIFQQYASGNPHIALVFGQGLFTLIGLFLLLCGHDFCRTCCPYGMGQSISAYQSGKFWQPMEPRLKPEKTIESDCRTCRACQVACPVDVDPRKPELLRVGQFEGCFNCGECIDVCNAIHAPKAIPGFLTFSFPSRQHPQAKLPQAKLEE